MPLIFSSQEMEKDIASRVKTKRLSLDLSQKTLSERSGVSLSVIKKFERSGKISLESLLKLALVLESLQEFENLFLSAPKWSSNTTGFGADTAHVFSNIAPRILSLDDVLKDKKRKRGRQ